MEEISFVYELPVPEDYFKLFENTGWFRDRKPDKEELILTLSKSYFFVQAYEGNKLVGSGRVVSDGILHAMIYDMIIDPEYQNKGIGSKILEMIVNKCNENNIGDIQLFCAKGKKEFYLKNGFEIRAEDAPGMQYNRQRFVKLTSK